MTFLAFERTSRYVVGISDRRVTLPGEMKEGASSDVCGHLCGHSGKIEPNMIKAVSLKNGLLAASGNHKNAKSFLAASKGKHWEFVVGDYTDLARTSSGDDQIFLSLALHSAKTGLQTVRMSSIENGRLVRLSYEIYLNDDAAAIERPGKTYLTMFFGPKEVQEFLETNKYAKTQVLSGCGKEHRYEPSVSGKAPKRHELGTVHSALAALLRFGDEIDEVCYGVGGGFDVSFLTRGEGAHVIPRESACGYATYLDLRLGIQDVREPNGPA
ncbi:MAG: hypothetical protein V1820_00890 [archaeon]